jgi:4-hydroxy-tetrahydrodipicolinate reductase
MRNIRVAVWGFGAMGGGNTKVLLQKTGVEITAFATCTQIGW